MAFETKDTFTFDHTAQAPYPSWTPLQTQQSFNARGEELRLALNGVINLLNATAAGASGAKNVGMTPITSIGTQTDVQSIVEALITRLQAITTGTSGAKFIGVESITGLTGNDVQTLLSALKTLVDTYNTNQTNALTTHKTSTDHDGRYYTEAEIDSKITTLNSADSTNASNLNTHKTSVDHDGRYYTETELGATTGAGLVGAIAPS
ncbi:hypothetical protein [Desulfitobacterium metallireducens]|uniref:Uncharacterized protein n=1 Tax=Desulfitobacterium metallireducens DSM 15288 TaxID=871968 RepID=W0ECR7_9FIRM|nr:hypothetical protein [Desulfitobacterium metallireducens]AHF08562.1 hypothetical protein DESME_08880 [Desulfitobacterium metallireducens DSM 15288]